MKVYGGDLGYMNVYEGACMKYMGICIKVCEGIAKPNYFYFSQGYLSFGVPSPNAHENKFRYQYESSCVLLVDVTFHFPALR